MRKGVKRPFHHDYVIDAEAETGRKNGAASARGSAIAELR